MNHTTLISADDLAAALRSPNPPTVLDCSSDTSDPEIGRRAYEAGHIPGAFNRPFTDNVGPDGRFKPADQLRQEFLALLGDRSPESVVHHCGSGVSALPNLLAMEVAGLGRTALYPGSWSEWCNTPGAPCAVG